MQVPFRPCPRCGSHRVRVLNEQGKLTNLRVCDECGIEWVVIHEIVQPKLELDR